MGWVIYILGFIVTYLLSKKLRNTTDSNDYLDVLASFVISFTAWVGAIALGIVLMISYLEDKNPPKWL